MNPETIAVFDVFANEMWQSFRLVAEDFSVSLKRGGIFEWPAVAYRQPELFVLDDGIEEPYAITGVTWAGHHMTIDDALAQIATGYVNDSPDYVFHEVCDALIDFRESVQDVKCVVSDHEIASRYYDFWRSACFDLVLVTDQFSYYAYEDSAIMLSSDDGRIISDNFFAQDGLAQSIENVLIGEEEEIWCDPSLNEYKHDIESSMSL